MQIQVDGIDTRYVLESEGAGPWVTFIHPLGGDLSVWDQLAGYFRHSHSVLRYDLRGHGQTAESPQPFTVADLAGDLGNLLGQLGVDRTHLVGLALGGMVAQEFALRQPQRTASLVLADTAAACSAQGANAIRERGAQARRDGLASMADTTLQRWFTEPYRRAHPEVMEQIGEVLRGTSGSAYAAASEALAAFDASARLPGIHAPTLVVTGEEDASMPPALGKAIADAIPGALWQPIAGAHLAPIEHPARFAALVESFWKTAV
jgi:3-oxoadipate enol-lactonase